MAGGRQRVGSRGGSEATAPFGRRPLRTFALAVALPAFLLYVGSAALVILVIMSMADDIDRAENARGIAAVKLSLDSLLNELGGDVADEAGAADAHANVVLSPNPNWMDATWGEAARTGARFAEAMVTTMDGDIRFGAGGSGSITGSIAERYPAAAAMLQSLDIAIGNSGNAAIVSSFTEGEAGVVALAAASIHAPLAEEASPRHARRILWLARPLTPAVLQAAAARVQAPLPALVERVPAGLSSLSLADASGGAVGTLAWMPDRPGEAAFRRALLVVSFAFFAVGVVLSAALRGLRHAMLARVARLEAAAEQAAALTAATAAQLAERAIAASSPAAGRVDTSLVSGVAGAQFTLAYQPVFDLRSEALTGADILLRWQRPGGETLLGEELPPAAFATLLEEAAILALRQACTEVGPLLGTTLTLPVTVRQLANTDFPDMIMGTLGAMRFPARRLQLVTDAALLGDGGVLVHCADDFRRMGVGLAISGFALSPATLDLCRPGLASRVMLPPALVDGVDGDKVRQQLVEATVDAVRAAGMEITVRGVNRKQDAARLLRLGCRDFSGPLLAPPLSLAGLTALVLSPPTKAAAG